MYKLITAFLAVLFVLFIMPSLVRAHCDSLNGPVVLAARKALENGNPNFILIWVKKEDEQKIKKAFKKALSKGKDKDREREFFETVVKIHREGEGAKFEGLKQEPQEPNIILADQAIAENSLEKVIKKVSSLGDQEKLKDIFSKLQETKEFKINDLESGRKYVETYIEFIHLVDKSLTP